MHNSKATFFFFFRSLCLRHRSINPAKLLITATLCYINQALLYYLTREIMTSSSHSSNRSANQDHVLQQTDATLVGEGFLDKKVLIVCNRCGGVVDPDVRKPKEKIKYAGYCIFVPTVSKLWVTVMQNSFFFFFYLLNRVNMQEGKRRSTPYDYRLSSGSRRDFQPQNYICSPPGALVMFRNIFFPSPSLKMFYW